MLCEVIGKPAMLEQTAEECIELAHACLKLARDMRGDNATHKDVKDIYDNLNEEMADVYICMGELLDAGILSIAKMDSNADYKRKRMVDRLASLERSKND